MPMAGGHSRWLLFASGLALVGWTLYSFITFPGNAFGVSYKFGTQCREHKLDDGQLLSETVGFSDWFTLADPELVRSKLQSEGFSCSKSSKPSSFCRKLEVKVMQLPVLWLVTIRESDGKASIGIDCIVSGI
jgi:hypothetical protein